MQIRVKSDNYLVDQPQKVMGNFGKNLKQIDSIFHSLNWVCENKACQSFAGCQCFDCEVFVMQGLRTCGEVPGLHGERLKNRRLLSGRPSDRR